MLTPMSNAPTLERPSFQALFAMGYNLSALSTETFAIYVQDRESYLNGQPVMRYFAMGFIGQQRKPAFNFRFKTALERDQIAGKWAAEQKAAAAAKAQYKAKIKAERAAFDARTEFKVDDILSYSWGYDQTQVEFFKVVNVIGRATLAIVTIGSKLTVQHSAMAGLCIADPETVISTVVRAHVGQYGVKMEHGHAKKWDGKPKYCSWYA